MIKLNRVIWPTDEIEEAVKGSWLYSSLPPALPQPIPSQEHSLNAGADFQEEKGVPADVPQHEVLAQQMQRLPPGGPRSLLLLRLQRSLHQHQVAHLPGDGEHQEGVEEHWELFTKLPDLAEQPAAQTCHV